MNGRRPSANDNEERKYPPSTDADTQLAIVPAYQATREADSGGAYPVCLHSSTWQPHPHPQGLPAATVRTHLLVRLQNLGWQLLQFLPFRDLSVLATASRGFQPLVSQHPAYLDALALHSRLVSPLADMKLLDEAGKAMRAFMREEHALVEMLGWQMEQSGWPTREVLKLMSELSPGKFAGYVEIDCLLKKAEAGTISEKEQRWLCFSLTDFEPPELVEEAIAAARQGKGEPLRDLARHTAINYSVSQVHDLAERSKKLRAEEDKLKLLPKHGMASLKAKYAHVKGRDEIHHLSDAQRRQLVSLSAQLTVLRGEDPRPEGLLPNILAAREGLQAIDTANNGTIQTRRLLAMGFEHELYEHLVECDKWIEACKGEHIDLALIDLEKVGMAWSRAGLPVSALQTLSEAIRIAHLDKGATLRVQLTVLRDCLLATATSALIEHYAVASNPTVSYSSSLPARSPIAVNNYTFAYVDPVTQQEFPSQTYVHIGDKPFAKKFFVRNDRDEIIHVRTHLFNARPQRSQRSQQPASGQSDAPVVMHFDESKRPWPSGSDPDAETKRH